MVGRKNVYISHWWAAMFPTLRTTDLGGLRYWMFYCLKSIIFETFTLQIKGVNSSYLLYEKHFLQLS